MSRYELLVNSIQQTDIFLVQMFLFALGAVAAYPVLGWLPVFFRRPTQWLYLALVLALYVATVYLSYAMK